MRRLLTALVLAWLVAFIAPAVVDAQTTPPFTATVSTNANLRSGPGTTYAIVGRAAAGATVQVVECNIDCSWYVLDTLQWIAAFLVEPVDDPPPATATPTPAVRPYTMPDMSTLMVAQVVRITDGDTIRVRLAGVEYPLRYIGVNTPEVGQPYAAEATALNSTLVSGQAVYLEKDVSETDRYNRLLRYVWLEDGTFVNYELVRQGYAQVATYPPDVKYEALYLEAQRQAIAEAAGLWAAEAESAPAVTATPVPVQPAGATANRNSNLRGGPGTSYAVVGSVSSGQALQITGRNQAGDWYQLASGAWIAAFLVNNAPSSLPVVAAPAAPVAPAEPTPVPVDTTTRSGTTTAVPTPQQSTAPQAVCDCSGNIYNCPNFSTHSQAQACYAYCIAQGRGDIHRLDGDSDGVACESLP